MHTTEVGLSSEEVLVRSKKYGANVLPEKPRPSKVFIFLSQLKNPLIYVLLVAGLVTASIGHFSDSLIIFVAVGINTVLGFIQEGKASDALYALKHYVSSKTTVIRDGQRVEIETVHLVPGDLVVLAQGDKIPADGKIIDSNRLYIDESILTGESVAVKKDKEQETFMGTIVVAGQAIMRVETIGGQTKMGVIALQIQDDQKDTPFQKQLKTFSQNLVVVVGALILLVLVIGMIYKFSWNEIFLTSVALAVSSIPEGLIVSFTVVLAIGMQKILKRRGLVRKLAAAETLGGVTVVCVDKTGTLTQGKMRVVEAVGDEKLLAQQVLLANDLDDPIVIAAFEWGRGIISDFVSKHPRWDSIPFSSEVRRFVSLHPWNKTQNRMYVNGAPEMVLEWTNLGDREKAKILVTVDDLTKRGMRLIGYAYKNVPIDKKTLTNSDGKKGMTWVGLLAFSDPVRSGVKEALESAKGAGIRTIVITGDYAKTSQYILAQLGIRVEKEQIMTGEELANLSAEQLADKVKTISLFARTTPAQKLAIVGALKKNGEVVAMMGDGVNDAPALHESDIGIAVGEATDVAKESADLVLLDSNFSTIIAAIEEGRAIFENIRKIVLYLMCDAFAEILIILGSIVMGFPLALTAVQILWINLVSDGLPNLALTIDPVRSGIMKESPRDTGEQLITRWMVALIGMVSVTAGIMALGAFWVSYKLTGDIIIARSMAFTTLGVKSLTYVFSVRSLMAPFWETNILGNKWLIVAVVSGFGLQVLPFATESTRQFFGVKVLGFEYWVVAMLLAFVMFLIIEGFKFFYRLTEAKNGK